MTASALKIIAIIAMLIDHVGDLFFPQHLWLRVIGRVTMPIMAFFAAEGYRHTRNINKYLLRLFVFALISEIPYVLVFGHGTNVIFTLFLGVLALYVGDIIIKRTDIKILSFLVYILFAITAELITSDWSYIGIGFICLFYVAEKSKPKMTLYITGWYLFVLSIAFVDASLSNNFMYFYTNFIQLAGLFSLPLLFLYNGKLGRNMKYFFYIFYPAHLIILFLIKLLI